MKGILVVFSFFLVFDRMKCIRKLFKNENDEEKDLINIFPFEITEFKLQKDTTNKYILKCNQKCEKIYFSLLKANIHSLQILIYEDYKIMKEDDEKKKYENAKKKLKVGNDINKNKNGFYESESNEIYFIIYNSLNSKAEDFIIVHIKQKEINIEEINNKCYKFLFGGNHIFNFKNNKNEINFLQYQFNTKKNIEVDYYIRNKKETNKIIEEKKKFINNYIKIDNNNNYEFYFNLLSENEEINFEICFEFLKSKFEEISNEKIEYTKLIISPGDFYFYSNIANNQFGNFLLTFNYNYIKMFDNVFCQFSNIEKEIDFKFTNNEKSDCEFIKDKFNYENYYVYFKNNQKNKNILFKVTINNNYYNISKQTFSLYKSYVDEINNNFLEKNISLFRNPYFLKMNISNFEDDNKIIFMLNDDITMNIIEGEFNKENYMNQISNKIKKFSFFEIKALKEKKIDEINIILHNSIPHQQLYFLLETYNKHTKIIMNNENINSEKNFKIEINDCINDKYYYIGKYSNSEEKISFIDYIYGIGEAYHSNNFNTSLDLKYKEKKLNSNFPLKKFNIFKNEIEAFFIDCNSPILAYLNLYPSTIQNINEIKEGEKLSIYLTKGKSYSFNLSSSLKEKNEIFYEIILLSERKQKIEVNIQNDKFNLNENSLTRKSFKPVKNYNGNDIIFENNDLKLNNTLIQFKIGISDKNLFCNYYLNNTFDEIENKKNLIINILKEDSKFKEIKIIFENNENKDIKVCSFFSFGKFPYIIIPKDNCIIFEKKKIKEYYISYPFNKIIDNNNQKTFFNEDDYLLIFSFPEKIIKPKIIITKEDEKIIKINHTNPYNKINYDNKLISDNYILISEEDYNKKNSGIFLYISYFVKKESQNNFFSYKLNYSNSIIKNEIINTSKSGNFIYSFKDNYINFSLEITSDISYNILMKKINLSDNYNLSLNPDLSIKKEEKNFKAKKILNEENVDYYYKIGNKFEDVIDINNLTNNISIENNDKENLIFKINDTFYKEDFYINIFAIQKNNYQATFIYNSLFVQNNSNSKKLSRFWIFTILIIVAVILFVFIIIIAKMTKKKDAGDLIDEQFESKFSLVEG